MVAKIVVGMEASFDDRIRKVAELLIVRYGERAAGHATSQAFKARQLWAPEYEEMWESIAAAVAQALRAGPGLAARGPSSPEEPRW